MAPVQSSSMLTKEPKICTKNRTLVETDGTSVIRRFFGSDLKRYDPLHKDSRPTDSVITQAKKKKN